MKVELFTLCDGAYNYNGKLTIVGTVDGIKVPQLPATAGFSIALKLLVSAEEQGSKMLSLIFKDPHGEQLPTDIAMNLNIQENHDTSHLSVAINMQGVPFKIEGDYLIEVKLDATLLETYSFNVKVK